MLNYNKLLTSKCILPLRAIQYSRKVIHFTQKSAPAQDMSQKQKKNVDPSIVMFGYFVAQCSVIIDVGTLGLSK